jgi:hypothetical protein
MSKYKTCLAHGDYHCEICFPLAKYEGMGFTAGGLREPWPPEAALHPKPTLLSARGKTHGNYSVQASITQQHRAVLRNAPGWDALSNVQKDAIEMISVKLSRILSGNPNHRDHWEDIAGYATLAANGGRE